MRSSGSFQIAHRAAISNWTFSARAISSGAHRAPASLPSCRPDHARSTQSHRTALRSRQPLGSAEVTHPFHPLRGHRFVVLKVRRISGVETLKPAPFRFGFACHAARMDRLGDTRRSGNAHWRRAIDHRCLRSAGAQRTHCFADPQMWGLTDESSSESIGH